VPQDRHGNAGVDVERGGRERSIETPRQLLEVDKSPPADGAVDGRTQWRAGSAAGSLSPW
jgi:hypothetical protein